MSNRLCSLIRHTVPAAAAAFILFAAADRAAATEYPWCARYIMDGDATNCGFVSYEQCKMTATPGSATICERNPSYVAGPSPKPATHRRHKS